MDEVISFIINNKDCYKEYLSENRLSKCKYGYTCDIDQIYCHLNLVNIKDTVYYKFYLLSKNYFNLDNIRILEVACGYIPIMSSIYKKYEVNNIEAINQKILIKNYKNVKTIEYDLTKEYNLSKYDLIIGIRPCNITVNIIKNCIKYKKNFMLYLCPCIPIIGKKKFNTYEEWILHIKNNICNDKNYNFEFINFKDDSICPIIVGKLTKYNLFKN